VHHWPELEAGLREAHRALRSGGRFLALERLVRPGATGRASHGWVPEQADALASRLADAGFADIVVERHGDSRVVLTVRATRV